MIRRYRSRPFFTTRNVVVFAVIAFSALAMGYLAATYFGAPA